MQIFIKAFFVLILAVSSQSAICSENVLSEYIAKTAIPIAKTEKNEFIIDHKYFVLSYDSKARLSNYVEYTLTRDHLKEKVAERQPYFTVDPQLIANGLPYNTTNDIKYSRDKFVKGHLAPATDFRFNQEAMDLANVMTNVAPQNESLNDKSWKELEETVRKWACGESKVMVITGPVLTSRMKKLESGVAVPKSYFKAIADLTPPIKAIGFIYAQGDTSVEPEERAMSISDLEEVVGYELFPFITDSKTLKNFDMTEWKSDKCYD